MKKEVMRRNADMFVVATIKKQTLVVPTVQQ